MPKPNKFSRIDVGSDIQAWLVRVQECLTVTGADTNVWGRLCWQSS